MAKSYYAIRDSATGLFFGGLAEHRQNPTDIIGPPCFLIMSKRIVGKKMDSIKKLEKYLRSIFYNRRIPTLQIPKFPNTFEVVHVVIDPLEGKRTITPTMGFHLLDFANIYANGPAFSSLMKKIAERNATDFKYALIISSSSFWKSDTKNINESIAFVEHTIRSTYYGQTAIAFKTENDAMAFRLGYAGTYSVKMVVIE